VAAGDQRVAASDDEIGGGDRPSDAACAHEAPPASRVSGKGDGIAPALLSVFDVCRGRTYTVDQGEVETICSGIITGEYRLDNLAEKWVSNQEYELLIEILWKVGFLRAYAVGGLKALRRSGSSYLGPIRYRI
jgi:hypothetical protein